MKKKEIIKLLDKEIALAIVKEDENTDGEMYITSAQLKTAEKVLKDLEKKRKLAEEKRQYYIKRIKEIGKEENVIFERADKKIITNSVVNLNKKLYLIGEQMVISNNVISLNQDKQIIVE